MQQITCPHCSTMLSENALLCPFCAKALIPQATRVELQKQMYAETAPNRRLVKIGATIGFALGVVYGAVRFATWPPHLSLNAETRVVVRILIYPFVLLGVGGSVGAGVGHIAKRFRRAKPDENAAPAERPRD